MTYKISLLLSILILPFMAKAQTTYQDQTFTLKKYEAPKSKSDWLKRQKSIRKTIWDCFGDLPPRPKKPEVKIKSREERDGYIVESFEFFNGADAMVPGIILIPKGLNGKAPAVLYQHYHGGEYYHGKDELFSSKLIQFGPGPELVKAGYIVMAIDAYAFGERSGKGPNGPKEKGSGEELTWAKMNIWKGRNHWGMMVRDDLISLDYLASRQEVDPKRIASIGLSMGCFRAFYLAALDDRVKVTVPVSCITRNEDLIKGGALNLHGVYYYVHGLMKYFDTESIMGCIAPRALLNLSGADDVLEPLEGQKFINEALDGIYKKMGSSDQFKYRIYEGVGHAYTAEMWKETMLWLKEKL